MSDPVHNPSGPRTEPARPEPLPPDKARQLVWRSYLPRLAFFTYNGLVWPLLLFDSLPGDAVFWTLWLGLHFVWPHIEFALLRTRPDPRPLDRTLGIFEAAAVGMVVNELDYLAWYVFAALAATLISAMGLAGMRQLLRHAAAFAVGTVAWGLLRGFAFHAFPAPAVELAGVVGGALPMVVIMGMTYRVMMGLAAARRTIERKNRLFESLLQMGVALRGGRDVDGMLTRALDELHAMLPSLGFGVVLQAPGRPQVVHHRCFRGMEREAAEALLAEVRTLAPGRDLEEPAVLEHDRATYHVLPMTAHLKQQRGCLIVQGRLTDPDTYNAITLFLEQLAATLESALLTARLAHQAHTDSLTGLYNRSYFNQAFARAADNHRSDPADRFALLLLDANGLKAINDRYGHQVGDEVIRTIADRLRSATRESDVVVRMGGDEFVVLAHACTSEQAAQLAERITAAMTDEPARIVLADGREVRLPVTVSLGTASTDELAPSELLSTADARMYAAKSRDPRPRDSCH